MSTLFRTGHFLRFTHHASRFINIFHLPCVQRPEFTILTLRTQRHTNAIFAIRVDAHCNTLLPVDEDLNHALVDEHTQLERLIRLDEKRRQFSGARESTSGAIDEYEESIVIRLSRPSRSRSGSLKPRSLKNAIRVNSSLLRRAEDVHFDHRCTFWINLGDDFHRVPFDILEDNLLIRG